MWARIENGRVVEFISHDPTGIFHESLVWADVSSVEGIAEGWNAIKDEKSGVWIFSPYVPPPPTEEEVLIMQSQKLQGLTRLASAQKVALTNRIETIQDAIDLEMATPEEVEELGLRQAQLVEWKRYGVLLGRVTSQAGWPPEVEWPEQPAEGMDLNVSAKA